MLRLSTLSFCSVFLLAVGCSTSNPPPATTTGGTVCMPACGANATCNADGTCSCYPNYTNCPDDDGGSACVQVLLDNNNCGGCGVVCPTGESCLGGACQCHQTTCVEDGGGSVCTDTQSDPLNCNVCGNVCSPGENCTLGQCTCVPSVTIAECATDAGLACVDLTKDNNNCGQCDNACADNQYCAAPAGAGGVCICNEPDGGDYIDNCNGTCVDSTNDPFNCGGCGNVCVSGSCILGDAGAGICNCPLPYSQCGPDCVDTFSDINHCGSCDNDCTIIGLGLTELTCNLGNCYCGPTGQGTICPDGVCSTLGDDPNNCGACGNVCLAPAQDCENGTCVCPDAESLCGSPDAGIPLFCINTTEDPVNCGSCGNQCEETYAANSGCRFGLCFCSPSQSHLCAKTGQGGAQPACECDPNSQACDKPSFAADIYPLLAQQSGSFGCSASGCHSGGSPAAGLAFLDSSGNMDAGMAYAELLNPPGPGDAGDGIPYCDGGVPGNAPATQCACVSRVIPGNHNGSYFIDTLLNDLPGQCAKSLAMPLDDAGVWTPLGSCSQQLMQQWVDMGAAP